MHNPGNYVLNFDQFYFIEKQTDYTSLHEKELKGHELISSLAKSSLIDKIQARKWNSLDGSAHLSDQGSPLDFIHVREECDRVGVEKSVNPRKKSMYALQQDWNRLLCVYGVKEGIRLLKSDIQIWYWWKCDWRKLHSGNFGEEFCVGEGRKPGIDNFHDHNPREISVSE